MTLVWGGGGGGGAAECDIGKKLEVMGILPHPPPPPPCNSQASEVEL